jgi:hypothetical protein
MSSSATLAQYELGRNSTTIKNHLNSIDSINKDISSVSSLTSTQSNKFRQILKNKIIKHIQKIENVHLKHKNNFIKKMKDKHSDVTNAKLRILRSDKLKAEKDHAILQLNMRLDMFLLKTVQEAQEHPFVKLHPKFILEIKDMQRKLSPKSPLKRTGTSGRTVTSRRTGTSRRTRVESARGKSGLKKKSKKNTRKKNTGKKNTGKKNKGNYKLYMLN